MKLQEAIKIVDNYYAWLSGGYMFTYNELNINTVREALSVVSAYAKLDLEEDGWSDK